MKTFVLIGILALTSLAHAIDYDLKLKDMIPYDSDTYTIPSTQGELSVSLNILNQSDVTVSYKLSCTLYKQMLVQRIPGPIRTTPNRTPIRRVVTTPIRRPGDRRPLPKWIKVGEHSYVRANHLADTTMHLGTRFPTLSKATYKIDCSVDSDNQITEVNERNNRMVKIFKAIPRSQIIYQVSKVGTAPATMSIGSEHENNAYVSIDRNEKVWTL